MRTMVVDANLFFHASKFAAQQKSRRNDTYKGVFIHPHKNGTIRLAASDGHRLIAFEDPTISPERFTIIVRTEKALVAACKGGRFSRYLHIQEDGEVSVVDATEKVLYRSPYSLKIDGRFPDYTQVIPHSYDIGRTKATHVGFDTSYLNDFSLGEKGASLVIVGDRLDILVVLNDSYPNMIGVLMPMRVEEKLPSLTNWIDVDMDSLYSEEKKEDDTTGIPTVREALEVNRPDGEEPEVNREEHQS